MAGLYSSTYETGIIQLYLASSSGKLDVVGFLIKQGADIHITDNDGSTPLHVASLKGHLDVIRMLVNSGIAVDVRDGTYRTPLALASREGKLKVVRLLIDAERARRRGECARQRELGSITLCLKTRTPRRGTAVARLWSRSEHPAQ